MTRTLNLVGALAALLLTSAPVMAQDFSQIDAFAQNAGLSEFRAGVMIDDVEMHGLPLWVVPIFETMSLNNLDTVQFDALFKSPDADIFRWIGSPRPTIGVTWDLQRESMIHASLNWHYVIPKTKVFVEAELGGALHDGTLTGAIAPMRNLGCRALFYWSISVGYEIDPRWNIMATEQHASQDGLCGWTVNQGLNFDGIRVGYKF